MEQKVQTLDAITRELINRGVKNKSAIEGMIHSACMLSFVEASYVVLNQTTMPTPLYRLVYDKNDQSLRFELLNGKAPVPHYKSIDINMLDQIMAGLFRERVCLRFEGKTGVGKTYTIENFFKTVLPEDNYRILRLNANMTNVLQPYTDGYIDNGILRIRLKKSEVRRIALLFVDEENRGDTNQILQLQDGKIRLSSGEGDEIGIPIPEYDEKAGWMLNYGRLRPLFYLSAQNPPSTKDAKYSAAKRTDAAQNNRSLKIDVPNIASRIGSSALLMKNGNNYHSAFINIYKDILSKRLMISESLLESLGKEWISIYSFITDPNRTECKCTPSSMEFLDAMLATLSFNIKDEFEHEKSIVKNWNEVLKRYGIDFLYSSELAEDSISISKLREMTSSFEEEFVPRDIIKVKRLADAISFTRRIKQALTSEKPVEFYNKIPKIITVQDIACGFAIVMHDKQEAHEKNPVALIDTVLKDYVNIIEGFCQRIGYQAKKEPLFMQEDERISVYNLTLNHAIKAVNKNAGNCLECFIKDVGSSITELKHLEEGSEYRKIILARTIADLTTLCGFAYNYSREAEYILKGNRNGVPKINLFKNFYRKKRQQVTTPDIYIHRLARVLAV